MVRFCKFPDCKNNDHARGYCAAHNWQLKKHQELRPIKKKIIGCSINGCDESHTARGFCAKHYREHYREYTSKLTKDTALEIKTDVLRHYSKKLSNSDIPCCRCCDEHEFLIFLTIDHITNRKNTTHKKSLVGRSMYRYLQKEGYPSGYQVLCWNCNSAKSDSGICPHKRSTK